MSFVSPYIFYSQFLDFHKKSSKDFDWDYIKYFLSIWGKFDIFNILSLPIHEHGIYKAVLHL